MLLGKTVFRIRQKGVPPLLLPASMLQLPRCLVRICNLFHINHKIANLTVSKNAIAAGKQIAKYNLLRKCGLLAHTSAAFLKNCCTEKLFSCLRLEFSTKSQKGTANHSRCPFLFKQLQLHASLYLHVPQIFLDSTSEHRSPDNLYSGKPADQSADQK